MSGVARSSIPFFGQAWDLSVQYIDNSGNAQNLQVSTDAWEPESLRITFEVLQSTIPSPWWFADITIYNLDPATVSKLVNGAVSVTLKAGFQAGPTSPAQVIWDGPILQVLLDQENVVDTRLTLHCVANPLAMADPVAFSIGQYASQAQLLNKFAAQIGLPPMENSQNVNTLSPLAAQVLAAKQYPRGNTAFGTMGQYLDIVASDQNLATYRTGSAAFMTEVASGAAAPVPDYIYSPPNPPNSAYSTLPAGTTQTIIGTPRQFAQGVIFEVLLDPRLQVMLPIQVVQLVGLNAITQIPLQIGSQQFPLSNLVFFVGQVRHFGDSRGNDWYTEVTGYNTQYATGLLAGLSAGSD